MKPSHLFLFGLLFSGIWQLSYRIVDGNWTFNDGYSYASVFVLVTMIVLWYAIDDKLNKTYKVTRWDE